MCDALDFFMKKIPCQEFKGHHSMMRQMKKMNSVYDLLGGYHDINHLEIVLQAMSNKDYS